MERLSIGTSPYASRRTSAESHKPACNYTPVFWAVNRGTSDAAKNVRSVLKESGRYHSPTCGPRLACAYLVCCSTHSLWSGRRFCATYSQRDGSIPIDHALFEDDA